MLRLIHSRLYFMIIFKIRWSLTNAIQKLLLIKIVSRCYLLSYCIEMRKSSCYCSCITIAVITDLFQMRIINGLEQIFFTFFPSIFIRIDIDFPTFHYINPLFISWLIDIVVGIEEWMLYFLRNKLLKVDGPPCQEEYWRFDNR